mmetsp:Transcript_31435/g.97044  ORF Transcript_31435/g.97044 Transcript_31435/m.97044 type:complete len:402 (+) Transcript_31435:65-1270(+)
MVKSKTRCATSEAVVEVGAVVLLLLELLLVQPDDLRVLLVGDVERGAADPALAMQLDLVVREPYVQRALVRVETRVLDRQNPRRRVRLVVVRVPPARRRYEYGAVGPVTSNGVDDVAVRVELAAHQRIDLARRPRRRHREVQRDGVVAVGLLHRPRADGVQERPHDVRQRLGCFFRRRVPQQHAQSIDVLVARPVADLLHGLQQPRAREQRRVEARNGRRHAQVVQQRLVVDPVQRGAAVRLRAVARVREGAVRLRDDEQIARRPRDAAVLRRRRARPADHVVRLRRRARLRGDGLAHEDAHVGREEVRRRAGPVAAEHARQIERDDARRAALVQRRRVHDDGNLGQLGVRGGAVLVYARGGLPVARRRGGLRRGGGFLARGEGGAVHGDGHARVARVVHA